jgi:hypothetical protein
MDISSIQSGCVGMALFDMWFDSVQKAHGKKPVHGDPLVAAAAQAFESYIQTQEMGFAVQIASLGANLGINAGTSTTVNPASALAYALNPNGQSVSPVSQQDLAPFLALNVMA